MRSLRNRLFHGRWSFLPQHKMVANVVGLPTSEEQTETRYSIVQLRESLQTMRVLRNRLSQTEANMASVVRFNMGVVRTRREPAYLFERCAAARRTTPR